MIEVIRKATRRVTAGRKPGPDPYHRDSLGRFARVDSVNASLGTHTTFRFGRGHSVAQTVDRLAEHVVKKEVTRKNDILRRNPGAVVNFVMHAHNLSLVDAVTILRAKGGIIGAYGGYKSRIGLTRRDDPIAMLAPGSKAFKDEVTKRGWTAMTAAEQKTLRKYDTLGRPIDTAAAMKGSQRIQLLPHHADVIDAWTKEGLAGRRAKKSSTGTMIFTNEKLLDHWHATWKAATSRVREGRVKDTQLDHIVPKAHFWMSNKAIISYINGPKNTTLLSTKDNRLKSNRIAHPKTGVPYYPRLSKAVLNNFHYEALYEHHLYEKETGHRFMGSRRITQAMLDDAKKKRSKAAWLARNRQRSPTK